MKIVISKIIIPYLQVVQLKLMEYSHSINQGLSKENYTSFCEDLVLLENVHDLLSIVNKKIDGYQKRTNLKLSISQAIVLQSACNFKCAGDLLEEKGIYQYFTDQVHHQIMNL